MNPDNSATLYYVHDPMCSWCWGFRPVWNEVRQRLPADIRLVSRVGGLAPDSDEPMPQALRETLQATWRRIQQVIPGTEFNFDFWSRNTPRRSTYPACRAVIIAREMANREDDMTLGIQHAYYLQARNPSDLDTLVDIADRIGLDGQVFRQRMVSGEADDLFQSELARVRGLGVNSFPSLVIEKDSQHRDIPIDYLSADNILQGIDAFCHQTA